MLWKSWTTATTARRPADASARRAVDPGQRTLDRRGARRAARPDPGRRPPPPRPPGRGGRRRGPRARAAGRPRPRPPGQGVRAHRARAATASTSSTTTWRSQALRFLAETGGDDAVREFAEPPGGVHRGAVRRGRARQQPDLSPAEVLAQVFTDEGYAAVGARPARVGEQLCQQHCPVSHVAHEFPQLCEAETEAISRVLGRHVQRLATIAHGDGVCTTCIPSTRPRSRPTRRRRSPHDLHRRAQPRAQGHRSLRVRLGRQRRRRRRPRSAASTRTSSATSPRRRASRSGCSTCA